MLVHIFEFIHNPNCIFLHFLMVTSSVSSIPVFLLMPPSILFTFSDSSNASFADSRASATSIASLGSTEEISVVSEVSIASDEACKAASLARFKASSRAVFAAFSFIFSSFVIAAVRDKAPNSFKSIFGMLLPSPVFFASSFFFIAAPHTALTPFAPNPNAPLVRNHAALPVIDTAPEATLPATSIAISFVDLTGGGGGGLGFGFSTPDITFTVVLISLTAFPISSTVLLVSDTVFSTLDFVSLIVFSTLEGMDLMSSTTTVAIF
mmetsp:Transcript_24024/g.37035  ORF Transcript_24024/g.37035 Transcript_24024/m.37035 type:complete len:265 (+) Transcript_24024:144-938(+)